MVEHVKNSWTSQVTKTHLWWSVYRKCILDPRASGFCPIATATIVAAVVLFSKTYCSIDSIKLPKIT